MKDVYVSYLMSGIAVSGITLYSLRWLLRGHARHGRVEAYGSSALLGRNVMDGGYWVLGPFAAVLERLGLTPNAVTLLSLIPGILSGVAFARGLFGTGAFMAMLCFLGDALDGILARRRGHGSDAGETLDAVADRYSEFLFLGGLVVYFRNDLPLLLITLAAALGAFLISYTTAKAEAMNVKPPRGAMRRAERAVWLTTTAHLTPYTLAWLGPQHGSYVRHLPIAVALTLVAAIANVSAARRTRTIMLSLRERDLEKARVAKAAREHANDTTQGAA